MISPDHLAKVAGYVDGGRSDGAAVCTRRRRSWHPNAGQYLDADHRRRRDRGHGDRARGSVRSGAFRADL